MTFKWYVSVVLTNDGRWQRIVHNPPIETPTGSHITPKETT